MQAVNGGLLSAIPGVGTPQVVQEGNHVFAKYVIEPQTLKEIIVRALPDNIKPFVDVVVENGKYVVKIQLV